MKLDCVYWSTGECITPYEVGDGLLDALRAFRPLLFGDIESNERLLLIAISIDSMRIQMRRQYIFEANNLVEEDNMADGEPRRMG